MNLDTENVREQMFTHILQMAILVCPDSKKPALIDYIKNIDEFLSSAKTTNDFLNGIVHFIGADVYENIKTNFSKNITHGATLFGKDSQIHMKTSISEKMEDIEEILSYIKTSI